MAELRSNFEDAEHWSELARHYYVRLPMWKLAWTPEKARYWLRKFRVTEAQYLEATGYKKIEDFQTLNPDWPLRAWVGVLLEYVNERDNAGRVLKAYER